MINDGGQLTATSNFSNNSTLSNAAACHAHCTAIWWEWDVESFERNLRLFAEYLFVTLCHDCKRWQVLIFNDNDNSDHDYHDEKMTLAMKIKMIQWKIRASITQHDNNDNDCDEMKISFSLIL